MSTIQFLIFLNIIIIFSIINDIPRLSDTTSINYGISQQPITDVNQLMPKLCQNQNVICEGSICIPGLKRCVCDLRMPVQFGRFCLRQVDIETKCFVSSQCNHTIKDAVCIDINSNAILDLESSKFKLEQWQQLNELRQISKSALSNEIPKQISTTSSPLSQPTQSPLFWADLVYRAKENVIPAHVRNSPYEINYTQELIQQNHTRKQTSLKASDAPNFIPTQTNYNDVTQNDARMPTSTTSNDARTEATGNANFQASAQPNFRSMDKSTSHMSSKSNEHSRSTDILSKIETDSSTTMKATIPETTTEVSSTSRSIVDLTTRKKAIVKPPNWPPGICLCPHGFMFDFMLRKCLALSLADSHCQNDNDCKQISMTHCSIESRKCECDEPLVWKQADLSCIRPQKSSLVKTTIEQQSQPARTRETGIFENLVPPLVLAKLYPDQTILLLLFAAMIILVTLIILKLTVKCFSSTGSALISPKHSKGRRSPASKLPPRSPYATLKRPEHKTESQLANFTQATRGRILNYDFEQDSLVAGELVDGTAQPPPLQNASIINSQLRSESKEQHIGASNKGDTLSKSKKYEKEQGSKQGDEQFDQLLELNDNISLNQLESESKSDNSTVVIPGPPPTQTPPYMLASAMRGQGSAIAAAAAAVANRRMQMAQKRNNDHQGHGRTTNESPVFL